MKKILLLTLSLIISASAFADEGYATCKISASEYVEATAYLSINSNRQIEGSIVLTNHASTPLQSASIRVVVNYSYRSRQFNDEFVAKTGTITVYNSRWTGGGRNDIPGFASGTIPVSGVGNLPVGSTITNIEVSISNPVCQ